MSDLDGCQKSLADPQQRRILVLGCSGRKRADRGLIAAVDRYDSPSFRVVRRYLAATHYVAMLDVFVLSAEHGLISADRRIALYDRQMTSARARVLRPTAVGRLVEHAGASLAVDVLISCGQTYQAALEGLEPNLPAGSTVRVAPSRPGERLACLHDWLYGRSPAQSARRGASVDGPVAIQLRGVRASLTADDLLKLGRQALASSSPSELRPGSWTVDLDGTAVSPKWLVGVSFDLGRGAFSTSDALRVLAMVGIPVRRTVW